MEFLSSFPINSETEPYYNVFQQGCGARVDRFPLNSLKFSFDRERKMPIFGF